MAILKEQLYDNIFNTQQLEETENSLLMKINTGLGQDIWEAYHHLIKKRDNRNLSSTEHQELIAYSDLIEETNARRMRYLLELARLRKISLDTLMMDLGIKK